MATYYSSWVQAGQPDIKLRMKIVTSYTQSTSNNTSTVTIKQYIESANYVDYGGQGDPSGYTWNHKLNFSGSTYSVSTEYGYTGNTRLIQTRTKTINHNSNGEGSFTVGGSCSANVLDDRGYGVDKTISISSRTVSLPKINRVSTISSNATSTTKFGDTITFSINRKSSSYTHTITYSMYNASGTIATGVGASYNWAIPTSLISYTPNNVQPNISITCITYSGNTKLGSTTYTFKCLVPDSYVPTCSLELTEANPIMLELDLGVYIQGVSQLNGVVTATGIENSTIASYLTTTNDVSYSTPTFITNLLKYNGERTVTSTIVDSRGRTATDSQTIEIIEYFQPTIFSCKVERCLQDGTPSEDGTYGKASISYKVAPVNNGTTDLNTVTVKVTYGTSTKTATLNSFEGTYTFTELFYGLETNATYNFSFEVVDLFNSQAPQVQPYSMPPSFVTISKLAGGKGVTFGQVASEEGLISHMNTKLYANNWANNMSINGLKTEKYAEGSWITYAEN